MIHSVWRYLSSLGAAARAPVSPPRMALLREVVWSAYALFSHPPAFQTLENPAFRDGLDALQGLLSRLQLADLGLDERRLEELVKEGEGRARVLYMSVVDAEAAEKGDPPPPHPPPHSPAPAARDPANVMTVAAFVVAPGGRLPLHDHPKMYGLLRLLHGQLTVYSYSSVGRAPSRPGRSQPCLLASKHPQKTVTPDSPPLVLRKNHEDIHAIHNDSQTTALFVDVLAPPYDFRKCDPDDEECSKGHRFISYYEEAGAATEADGAEAAGRAECVVLEEVPCPEWFNTDHVPYTGPSLL